MAYLITQTTVMKMARKIANKDADRRISSIAADDSRTSSIQ